MEIRFTQTDRKYENVCSAVFLAAILCNMLATLDWLQLLPAAAAGVVLPLIPWTKQRKVQYVLMGILTAFALIRFHAVLDGMKLLANRMFLLSEQTQSYEYDYFTVSGESALEAVLWLSMMMGFLCAVWGERFNGVLCGGWIFAMAYFGVTPGIGWLAALLAAGLITVLPGQQRWFYGIIVTVLVVAIALAVTSLSPDPSKAISELDDDLRDVLTVAPVTYEQTPVPTQVPEPEIIPPPDIQQEQSDHGVQKMAVNILFFVLAALTLALLFIPAVIKDRAAKRSEENRAGLNAEGHAAAIKAMYLYALRWREISDAPCEIPEDVYSIWQEAAYSDHAMGADQREIVHGFMEETAKAVWAASDRKKRLVIRYRIAL